MKLCSMNIVTQPQPWDTEKARDARVLGYMTTFQGMRFYNRIYINYVLTGKLTPLR